MPSMPSTMWHHRLGHAPLTDIETLFVLAGDDVCLTCSLPKFTKGLLEHKRLEAPTPKSHTTLFLTMFTFITTATIMSLSFSTILYNFKSQKLGRDGLIMRLSRPRPVDFQLFQLKRLEASTDRSSKPVADGSGSGTNFQRFETSSTPITRTMAISTRIQSLSFPTDNGFVKIKYSRKSTLC